MAVRAWPLKKPIVANHPCRSLPAFWKPDATSVQNHRDLIMTLTWMVYILISIGRKTVDLKGVPANEIFDRN